MLNEATGIIFRRTLRDARKGIIGWGLLLAGLGFMVVSVFPSIEGMLEAFGPLLENPLIKALVGNIEDFTTLEGFLGVKLLALMPLVLGVYAVLFALGIVGTEEEQGTLDILLSTPAPRWRILVEKFAALVLAVLLILVIFLAGLLAGGLTLPDFPLSFWKLAGAVFNVLPSTLLMAALTLLLTTVLRGRNQAGAVAAGFIAASYFGLTLADMAGERFAAFKTLSFFNYYKGEGVLIHGIIWGDFVLLLAGAAVLFGLSLALFQRRDLGT